MSMQRSEQILVLPSNVASHASNRHNDYITQLKMPLSFEDREQYECGLLDFFGSFNLANERVDREDARFYIGSQEYNIKPKLYKKQNDILEAVNKELKNNIVQLPLSCWKENDETLTIGCNLSDQYFKLGTYLQLRLGISNRRKTYYHDRAFNNFAIISCKDRDYLDTEPVKQRLQGSKMYINEVIFLYLVKSEGNTHLTAQTYIQNQLEKGWSNPTIKGVFQIMKFGQAKQKFRIFFIAEKPVNVRFDKSLHDFYLSNPSVFDIPTTKQDFFIYETPVVQKKVDMKKLNEALNNKVVYIYTDFIRFGYTGDSLSPLLRAIPVNINKSPEIHFTPQNILYLPINKTFLDSIRIFIKDSRGNDIKFARGPNSGVTVVLSIRKRGDNK